MQHQKAIGLTEAQKTAVISEIKRAQGRMVDVQWDLTRAMERLVEQLAQDKVDEPAVLAQLDSVLAAEREAKRAQLGLAVRLKNLLTPEQQRILRELRRSRHPDESAREHRAGVHISDIALTRLPAHVGDDEDASYRARDEVRSRGCPPVGAFTVRRSMRIVTSCTIRGDLVVTGGAVLDVDYSLSAGARFVVMGDVTLEGNATLWVHGSPGARGVFVVDNQFSQHRSLTSKDDSTLRLEHVQLETQAAVDPSKGSVYMSYEAQDRSRLIVDNASVATTRAWLLATFRDRSALRAIDADHVPTEIYVRDASSIWIGGDVTRTGLWLDAGGAHGALVLPDVSRPYTWSAGRGSGLDVGWTLDVDGAQPGLGLEVWPGTSLVVHGNGAHAPATGELKIAWFVEGGSQVLQGLKPGLQNRTVGDRLVLDGVQLGPIAWQIYAGDDARLSVVDSTVNEIGIFGRNAHVTVDESILQLAVLAALGPGSTLAIRRSLSWNQSIEAAHDAIVTIEDSAIHGSLLHARDAKSAIAIEGGAFFDNPAGCTESTMVDIATGRPRCNPFRPAGPPQRTGAGTVTCAATARCRF